MGTFSLEKAKGILESQGRSAQLAYCLKFVEGDTKDDDALACLGHYYHNANETERDLEKAEAYYREAVLGGSELGETLLVKLICQYMHIDISFSGNKVRLEHREEKMDFPLDLERAESLLTWYGQVNNAQMEWIIPSVFVWLGYIYEEGLCGVEPNPEKAKVCYKYAADRQDEEGEFRYADLMAYGDCKSNDPESYEYYQRSAKQGYVPAMLQLGRFISNQRHRRIFPPFSKWTVAFLAGLLILIPHLVMFLVASEHISSQVPLWIENGMQICGSIASAAIWYLSVVLLLWGIKIKYKQIALMGVWLLLVAAPMTMEAIPGSIPGFPTFLTWAINAMGFAGMGWGCLSMLLVLKRDDRAGFAWIQKAADTGDSYGIYKKASALFYGNGVKKNRKQAIEYYREAAEKGSADAKIALGHLYRFGRYVPKNHTRAFELFKEAADAGDYDGQYMVGYCYEFGIGKAQDMVKAQTWYQLGRENGSTLAKDRLNKPLRPSILNVLQRTVPSYSEMERLRYEVECLRQKNEDNERQIEQKDKQIEVLGGQVLATVTRIEESVGENGQKIDGILDGLDEINQSLCTLSAQLETAKGELKTALKEDSEVLLEKFSEYCRIAKEATVERAKDKFSESYYMQSETLLKKKFGDVWDRLQPDSQVSLISARTLFELVKKNPPEGSFDYSGIAISASSALENELSRLFFKEYIDHIKSTGLSFPVSLLKPGTNKKKTRFTLGDLLDVLEAEFPQEGKRWIYGATKPCSMQLSSYLRAILKEQYYDSVQPNGCFFSKNPNSEKTNLKYGSFVAQCEHIRDKYRNPSAHASTVDEGLARSCCSRIMGEYEANVLLNSADSVLILLFEMLK